MITALVGAAILIAPPPFTFEIYGIGHGTCAAWLSTASNEAQGSQWILGYWSALNDVNGKNLFLAVPAGGAGIVSEVKWECQAHPTEPLVKAVVGVYSRMTAVPDMAP